MSELNILLSHTLICIKVCVTLFELPQLHSHVSKSTRKPLAETPFSEVSARVSARVSAAETPKRGFSGISELRATGELGPGVLPQFDICICM